MVLISIYCISYATGIIGFASIFWRWLELGNYPRIIISIRLEHGSNIIIENFILKRITILFSSVPTKNKNKKTVILKTIVIIIIYRV